MKSVILAARLAGLVMVSLATTTPVWADTPGKDWISVERVGQILKEAGYGPVLSIEADDGHWEGKTTKGDQKIEFHVDPHTGKITKAEPDK